MTNTYMLRMFAFGFTKKLQTEKLETTLQHKSKRFDSDSKVLAKIVHSVRIKLTRTDLRM